MGAWQSKRHQIMVRIFLIVQAWRGPRRECLSSALLPLLMGATRSPFADTGSGRYLQEWPPGQSYEAAFDAAVALAGTVLGKRSRGAEDDGNVYTNDSHHPRPSKKGKEKMAVGDPLNPDNHHGEFSHTTQG
jgi:hypothetical protein